VHAIFTMFIRLTFLRFPSKIIERAYPIRAFALPAAVKRQNKTFGSSPSPLGADQPTGKSSIPCALPRLPEYFFSVPLFQCSCTPRLRHRMPSCSGS
jgi:hypothetical protein